MGGKMSANSKSIHILNEYKFLSKLINLNMNILGICLGAQMISKIYGSKIVSSKNKIIEVGYRKIKTFNNNFVKDGMSFMQFHNEGITYNKSMNVFAKGRLFEIDAFKIKNKNIYGFQFHPEINEIMIKNWYLNINKKKKGIDKLNNILKDYRKFSVINYYWLNKFLKKIIK
tara:strand:- start:1287 stop:1802 length:516 start_codon:yes stop_codon:yes gene_type:complete